MQKFEKGFFIGAATAAHQVEGTNTNQEFLVRSAKKHSDYEQTF